MCSFWQCIERWLMARRDAFVNRHLQAARSFVVVDADTMRGMRVLALLEQGQVARTTNYPDIDEKFGKT